VEKKKGDGVRYKGWGRRVGQSKNPDLGGTGRGVEYYQKIMVGRLRRKDKSKAARRRKIVQKGEKKSTNFWERAFGLWGLVVTTSQ